MTTPALVDVNVLLSLLIPQHIAHGAARRWLEGLQPAGTLCFTALTQLGVLRLLSQPRVMGTSVLAPAQALHVWRQLETALPLHEAGAVPPDHARHLETLVAQRVANPNLWTDAWLAALALALDWEMVTFDRGFLAFPGLRLRLLET